MDEERRRAICLNCSSEVTAVTVMAVGENAERKGTIPTRDWMPSFSRSYLSTVAWANFGSAVMRAEQHANAFRG